jgi:glucose dehydrogenase
VSRSVRPLHAHDTVNTAFHVYCALVGTVIVVALSEVLPGGGLILIVATAALALTAAIGGTRLPLALRLFATIIIFYFGYSMCLVGRTMEPLLTRYTVSMALASFGLFAVVPSLSLLRLWTRRAALVLVIAVLPLSLVAASVVAGIEERIFAQKHRDTGVGPTPRWTVSNHWLSYDRDTQHLNGSD